MQLMAIHAHVMQAGLALFVTQVHAHFQNLQLRTVLHFVHLLQTLMIVQVITVLMEHV